MRSSRCALLHRHSKVARGCPSKQYLEEFPCENVAIHLSSASSSSPATGSSPRTAPPSATFGVSSLSRRHARQLERRYGPLWRYIQLSKVTPGAGAVDQTAPSPATASSSLSVHDLKVTEDRDAASTKSSAPNSRSSEVHVHGPDSSLNSAPKKAVPPTASSPHHPTLTGGAARAQNEPGMMEEESDPLLEFLNRDDEDAAAMLAMWTSINRSCLYSSELSEAVVLRVRFFFHTLVRYRAIAAAVQFYERLAHMGVSLPHNDVLLLLTSLPYEQSSAGAQQPKSWIAEDEQARTDRMTAERRRAFNAAEEARYRSRRKHQSPSSSTPVPSSTSLSTPAGVSVTSGEGGAPSTAHDFATPSRAASDDLSDSFPSLRHQPEWVKRWVLYEASMGNIDLEEAEVSLKSHVPHSTVDGKDASQQRSTTPDTLTGTPASVEVFDDNNVGGHPAATTGAVAEANLLMEITTLVDHLNLLQVTTLPQADPSSSLLPHTSHVPSNLSIRKSSSSDQPIPARRAPSASIRVRRASLLLGDRDKYWMEALKLVEKYAVVFPHERATHTSSAASSGVFLPLPPALASTLHRVLRCSCSSSAAVQYMSLVRQHFAPSPDPTGDIALWSRLVLREGWSWLSHHEELVEQMIFIPCGRASTDDTALAHAVRSAWLAYLCFVKSSRAGDDFFLLLAKLQQHCSHLSGLRGDTLSLIQQCTSETKQSLSLLTIDVRRLHERRAAHLLTAPSLLSGAYIPRTPAPGAVIGGADTDIAHSTATTHSGNSITGSHPWRTSHLNDDRHPAPLNSAGLVPHYLGAAGLLTPLMLDVFVLNCAGVAHACELNSFRENDVGGATGASSTSKWLQIVEQLVYGPVGIWSVFNAIYATPTAEFSKGKGGRHSRVDGNGAFEEKKSEYLEKNYAALHLSECLIKVILSHCSHRSCASTARRGVHSAALVQVSLLLELLNRTLDEMTPHYHTLYVGEATQLAVVHRQMGLLCKQLLVFLHLLPMGEREVFGAADPNVAKCLASLGAALVRFEHIAATTAVPVETGAGSRRAKRGATGGASSASPTLASRRRSATAATATAAALAKRRPLALRTVVESLSSPRVKAALCMSLSSDTATGRQARAQLSAAQIGELNRLLAKAQKQRRATGVATVTPQVRTRGRTNSAAAPPSVPTAALSTPVAAVARTVASTVVKSSKTELSKPETFVVPSPGDDSSGELHKLVYRAALEDKVLPDGSHSCHTQLLQLLNHETRTWEDALRLCFIATDDVRVGRGALPLSFFVHVMDTAVQRFPPQDNHDHDGASTGSRKPYDLWQAALRVVEAAVDHRHAFLEQQRLQSSSGEFSSADATQPVGRRKVRRQVLDAMLPSVLRWCMLLGCREQGRQLHRTWSGLYRSTDRRETAYRLKNIEMLLALKDPNALALAASQVKATMRTCTDNEAEQDDDLLAEGGDPTPEISTSELLLVRAARQHPNWARALEALTQHFGSLDTHVTAARPYPAAVASAILLALTRCPQNMSASGKRLRQLQGGALWGTEDTMRLSQMLLNARRWKEALSLVQEELEKIRRHDGDVVVQPFLHASLLVCGLRACAIGGASDEAAPLYDAFQSITGPVQEKRTAQSSVEATDDDDDLLGAALQSSSTAAPQRLTASVESAEWTQLSTRARVLFFRAMTKKLSKPEKKSKTFP